MSFGDRGRRNSRQLAGGSKRQVEALECRRLLALVPVMVADIGPGTFDPSPAIFANFGDTAFFVAETPSTGRESWKTDGTPEGTVVVKDFNPDGPDSVETIHDLGGKLLIHANSSEGFGLYTSDGTSEGTVRIPNFSSQGNLQYPTVVDGKLYFTMDDGVHGREMWVSDGTEDGTRMFMDIIDGPATSGVRYLTHVNGTLFFVANGGVAGLELWKTDGTEEGTSMVKEIRPGDDGHSAAKHLAAIGDRLFFVANDGVTGYELWTSDGTEAGTVRLTDIQPGITNSYPGNLTDVNGTLFFSTQDADGYASLFKSDGTPEGTVKVKRMKDPAATNQGSLGNLTNADGVLYFSGSDGVFGNEPWVSDGTETGTRMIKDIRTASSRPFGPESLPHGFTHINGQVYFTAIDNADDREIWVTNGSAAGTYRVADIRPGPQSSSPDRLKNVNGTLYFVASDGIHGTELWRLVSDRVQGDTDLDGDVDLDDLNNVRNHFGDVAPDVLGDTNGDDHVDLNDLNNVRNNFGSGGSSPAPIATRPRLTRPVDEQVVGNSRLSRSSAATQDAIFRGDVSPTTNFVALSGASLRKRPKAVDQVFALL